VFSFSDLEQNFGDIHPGLELVAVVPVGIPLHIYEVDLTLYEAKDYPLLNEHILRSLNLGLNSVNEISSFLGVELDYVADAVAHEDANIGTVSIAPNGRLKLTEFGRGKLDDLTISEARRQPQKLHVDLITGQVTFYRKFESTVDRLNAALEELNGEEYVRRLEAQDRVIKNTSDFTVEQVDALLTNSNKLKKISVLEVLASKRVSKKPFYALGQILVFADPSGERVMLNMTVDGERKVEHDRTLARPEIREILNIHVERAPDEIVPGQIFQNAFITTSQKAIELVRKLEDLPEIEEVEQKSPWVGGSRPTPVTVARPSQLGPAIFRPQPKPVRLKVMDLPQYRREAIRFAKERLLIVSPWVKIGVVNDEFVQQLENAVLRGVMIDIALGYGDDLSDSHPDAVAKLVTIAEKHPSKMRLHKWRSHEKVIIADQSFIESTFNWLSFQGANDRHYRRERGTLTVDRELADEVYVELLEEINEERDTNWPPSK
jgi:hypothetical protein